MNIILFNYEYPPLGGGAGNATWYLLRELSQYQDLSVDLITSSLDAYRQENPWPNVRVHYLDIGKRGGLHYQSSKDLLVYAWKSYRYARRLIGEGRFHLIHAFFGIPSGYVAMKLGLPYLVSLRGSDVPFYNRRFKYADRLLFKRLSGKIWRQAAVVAANSAGLKNLALQSHPQIPITVIPNGIDTRTFFPQGRHKQHTPMTIVSTGRLIQRKGYDLLIHALAGVPATRLVLAGDGPEKDHLLEVARQLKVDLECLGAVEHEAIPAILQKADLFVLPSRNEGMSNSVLEAMACGLPVIATEVGGSRELIDRNGSIVPCNDTAALREKILDYIHHPELLAEHGHRSRQIAEQMSWRQVAEEYVGIYVKGVGG
jgi:glycosyltransferase involved in cell wall biosynthesis